MNYIVASMIPMEEDVSRRTRKKRIIKRVNGLIAAQEFRMTSGPSRKGSGSSARLLGLPRTKMNAYRRKEKNLCHANEKRNGLLTRKLLYYTPERRPWHRCSRDKQTNKHVGIS